MVGGDALAYQRRGKVEAGLRLGHFIYLFW